MSSTDVKKQFGLAVKKWRGETGISQEELAWRAGLHRTYLADIERGARNASLQSIEKLAKALNLSLSTLFEPLNTRPKASGPSKGTVQANSSVGILLVEDDPLDVELTLKAFHSARLTNRIYVVRDGAEALDFVFCQGAYLGCKRAERPQVMLLDLSLPRVHALELLRAMKEAPATRTMRVVVLTDSHRDEDVREALQLGAEACIIKPVDFNRLSAITPRLDFSWTLQQSPLKKTKRELLSR